ncbi:hypothetical protein GYB59_06305 [bacterium]|nr:hypothetical protein [bacterium]
MPFQTKCPHCQTTLRVDEKLEGRNGKCIKCKHMFLLERSGEALVSDPPRDDSWLQDDGGLEPPPEPASPVGKRSSEPERGNQDASGHQVNMRVLALVHFLMGSLTFLAGVVLCGISVNRGDVLTGVIWLVACIFSTLGFFLVYEGVNWAIRCERHLESIACK